MAIDKGQHLQCVLESHKMRHVQKLLDKYIGKREQVKEALEKKYSSKLCTSPINSGSYAKHTAINIKFDMDICLPFKRNSFATLAEMADEIHRFFNEEYKDVELLKPIRRQRVSCGLTFRIGEHTIEMDIVPGRELNQDEYGKTGDLKLYVRADNGKPESEIKTNIQKHIDLISGKNAERDIIRLLKIWKSVNGKDIKSFVIELLVIRAFESNSSAIPNGLWEKLEMTLQFIWNNIETIQLKDPANSNNIVSDTIDIGKKKSIAGDVGAMLRNIRMDSSSITTYFPVNAKFPCTDNGAKYQKKEGPAVLSTKSFG